MNSKDIKKYSLINQILNSDFEDEGISKLTAELATIDFVVAVEVWEYVLTANQKNLDNFDICVNLESRVFNMLNNSSESRTKQLILESLPLVKLIYQQCASSCTGTNLQFLANLILSSKPESAEELLRCVKANACGNLDYGTRMKAVIDTVFNTYCTKNSVKKCELTRKQSKMLLEYVSKIKGPNKNLLTQRIKEL